jgi:hypothetical protein
VIHATAEGFNMVGGRFSMKNRFWSLWLRKDPCQQVQTMHRIINGICTLYLLSWYANGKEKLKKAFSIVEIEESKKMFDSAGKK